MKKLHLGNSIIKLIFVLSIFTIALFGKVEATLSQTAIYKGDMVELTLSASGDDIKFPTIYDIGGFKVLGTAHSSSTSIINGNISKSISKTYTFAPTHSFVIPSYTIKVDGKDEQTKSLQLNVVKPSASKMGDDFILEATIDKKDVYVGEEVLLSLSFKRKLNAKAAKIELNEPSWDSIWIKRVGGATNSSKGDYIVTTYKYLLFPQKSGKFTLDNLFANIATLHRQKVNSFFNDPFFDNFNTTVSYKKIFAKSLNLDVKPLPNGVDIYGDFTIKTNVDKTTIEANKPVNFTIIIKGSGNFDDIKEFSINIPEAVAYSDKPQVKTMIENNKYKGIFTQKIAFIADKDFTIPSVSFQYFSKKTKKITTIKTKPISIKVLSTHTTVQNNTQQNKQTTTQPKIELSKELEATNQLVSDKNQVIVKKENSYVAFIVGIIFGIVLTLLVIKLKTKKMVKELPIITKIKKAKNNNKKLFKLLLPYKNQNQDLDNILEKLEENIYNNKNNKIDINELIIAINDLS